MATSDIGRVTPIWRGFYSAAATYELNDIVIDTAGSVWWHKSEELTTGVIPEAGEIWDAVIDMSVFSGLIQAAITTAQTALAAAQEAVAEVTADTERAETAADNAENSAAAASESAAGVGALAQAAERSAEAAAGSATGAAGSAQAAAGSKSDAEAYAVGTRGGEDVGDTDPTFHNNAKFYAEQAASEAEAAAQSAEDAQEVLDSIPADYSTLSADVGDLKTQLFPLFADFENVTRITTAVDLNTYMTPGNYNVPSAADAARITNGPTTAVGYRLVILATTSGKNAENPRLYQIAFTNSVRPYIWVRNYASTHWNDWMYIASVGYVDSSIASESAFYLPGYASKAKRSLDANENLNDITTPGSYTVVSAAIAATITNAPVTNTGYVLYVIQTTQSSRLAQIAVINGRVEKILFRTRYSNTSWSEWGGYTGNPIDPTDITIDENNYATYAANRSFNDLRRNGIYRLAYTAHLEDGPVGDQWIGSGDREAGYADGTLMVYSINQDPIGTKSGIVQVLVGSRYEPYYPTFAYRIAYYVSNAWKWSPWSKFEQNGYLHASNIVVYGGSLDKSGLIDPDTGNADLNNMPSNCIMQLDLNLNGSDNDHTLLHHPAPGVSCVAMCYAFSWTSMHGKVQTVYTIDGRLYWRYGYFQASNDYRWTAWNHVVSDSGNYLQNKGRLANNSDLNNVKENGVWLLGSQSGAQYVNNPLSTGAGYLTVKWNSTIGLQVVEALAGTRYSRYTENGGETWSAWA